MAIVEVKVPQLSESVAEATLLQWKKKPGEAVAQDEILIEIETDKVVLEVPAPAAGVMGEIVVGDGGTVVADQVIAKIDTEGKAGAAPAAAAAAPAPALPSVSIFAITWSEVTVPPSPTTCSAITPALGAGTSSTTLSVSISIRISSWATASPGFFFQDSRVASATDSDSCGTLTSTIAILILPCFWVRAARLNQAARSRFTWSGRSL